VGAETQTANVEATAVGVNTEQSSVQGVLTATQIENLPVNGRNFLDLAQLEPGVQIQGGTNFDPTKIDYQSISSEDALVELRVSKWMGRTSRTKQLM
jgi:hypothetical protein